MRLLIAVCAWLLLVLPALGQDDGKERPCSPVAAVLAALPQITGYKSHEVLDGDQSLLAREIFTDFVGGDPEQLTVAVIVTNTDGSGVIMVGADAKICIGIRLPHDEWQAFIRGMYGEHV